MARQTHNRIDRVVMARLAAEKRLVEARVVCVVNKRNG
jgi:hypothetical protein